LGKLSDGKKCEYDVIMSFRSPVNKASMHRYFVHSLWQMCRRSPKSERTQFVVILAHRRRSSTVAAADLNEFRSWKVTRWLHCQAEQSMTAIAWPFLSRWPITHPTGPQKSHPTR
jgi:hypothetical protein